ncbi:unnamed protein product [Arabidopsis halleri]
MTTLIMYLLIVFLSLLGSVAGTFFGRFLGSEGSAIMTTTCVSFFALGGFLCIYRIYYFRLKRPLRGIISLFLVFSMGFVGSLIRIGVIHLVGGLALPVLGLFVLNAIGGQALPSTGPSGSGSSSVWEEDSFELGVLGEPFSSSKTDTDSQSRTEEGEPSVNQGSPLPSQTEEGEPSVNQVPQEAGPALPANPVPSGGNGAGPSNALPAPQPAHVQPQPAAAPAAQQQNHLDQPFGEGGEREARAQEHARISAEVETITNACENEEAAMIRKAHVLLHQRGITLEDPEDVKRALQLALHNDWEHDIDERRRHFTMLRRDFGTTRCERWNPFIDELRGLGNHQVNVRHYVD